MPIHLRFQPLLRNRRSWPRWVPIPVAGAEKSDLWLGSLLLQSQLFLVASPLDSCPLPARPLEVFELRGFELITPELARVKNK